MRLSWGGFFKANINVSNAAAIMSVCIYKLEGAESQSVARVVLSDVAVQCPAALITRILYSYKVSTESKITTFSYKKKNPCTFQRLSDAWAHYALANSSYTRYNIIEETNVLLIYSFWKKWLWERLITHFNTMQIYAYGKLWSRLH